MTAHLVVPGPRWRTSLLSAVAERDPAHAALVPSIAIELTTRWSDPDVFARWVDALVADAEADTPRAQGRVATTERWWVDGDTFLGRASIRHELTPALRREGGNLGYALRPSARGRGHGRALVGAARMVLADLDIHPALVTVAVDNVASRRVLEANDATQLDVLDGMARYRLPTRHGPGT